MNNKGFDLESQCNQTTGITALHRTRYAFEHVMVRDLLYEKGIFFMASIAGEDNKLNEVFTDWIKSECGEMPYDDYSLDVKTFRVGEILVARIVFPRPETEPLCYESYALFDMESQNSNYYCIEYGGADDGTAFLCSWSKDEEHSNYGKVIYDEKTNLGQILELFQEEVVKQEEKTWEL